ncbi:Asp/Glu/hydantoin racemase (plasmid) [Acinetobacter sp. NCu2D-2]|uniref:aspartate/glutamate racemase family protein n=1 Tax=Acinetobacter sp. NCu2D-2 TaxID=1608473 RepID=UPI0007CDC9B0|nr:aspartate/glutamate racemase family protein [Acinetobacter sp. NCu2D-2]ANF83270.1 Asp/Glu/hydantoin racemase [Acinetobacter sp. NCu2D-2]
MRIQIINPNTCQEMTNSIAASAQKVADSSTEIIAVSPNHGVLTIEGHYDEAIASFHLLDLIKAGQTEKLDGHIIACFGDPGLDAARELATAPVIGIAEAAFHMATFIATKFSVVTTLKRTKIITEHLLHKYGYLHKCEKIHCIDLPVLDLETNEQATYEKLLSMCLYAKESDDIGAIVLGCGGMSKHVEQLTDELKIPVIDGVTAAVKLLEALHGLGLTTSKWGDYAYPNQK